jgi:DNA-binding CsgD family transcriptional regulator
MVSTPHDIESRLLRVEQRCQESVDILVKDSPSDTSADALTRILKRAIPIRCIYERSVLDSPEGQAHVDRWRELGEEQRFVDAVPFRAAVFDRSIVLVPTVSDADVITSLLVVSAGLGAGVAYLFDLLWQSDTDDSSTRKSHGMSPEGLAALRLMCEGMSDQKIANQLGVSVRTVQRRLGELAAWFGAASRPALAARAVMAGIVTPFEAENSGSD